MPTIHTTRITYLDGKRTTLPGFHPTKAGGGWLFFVSGSDSVRVQAGSVREVYVETTELPEECAESADNPEIFEKAHDTNRQAVEGGPIVGGTHEPLRKGAFSDAPFVQVVELEKAINAALDPESRMQGSVRTRTLQSVVNLLRRAGLCVVGNDRC